MRNASSQQGEASKVKMSSSEKKKCETGTQATKYLVSTYDIFFHKCVTRKFQVVVVQNNGKEMYQKTKKCAACAKFFFCCLSGTIEFFAVLVAVAV